MTDVTSILDEKIAELETQLAALKAARTALAGGRSASRATGGGQPGRRRFTSAQREEISRRMKATWAKRKQVLEGAGGKSSSARSRPARKRRLSPEGRARIAEAARKRWAAHRKQHGS